MDKKSLADFKEQLLAQQRQLVEVVQKTQNYGREIDSEAEAMDIADKASSSYTKEFMFSKSASDRQFLRLVNEALDRIEDGTYGKCVHCGEAINRKRLEAVPWTRLCIKCQELQEQGRLEDV